MSDPSPFLDNCEKREIATRANVAATTKTIVGEISLAVLIEALEGDAGTETTPLEQPRAMGSWKAANKETLAVCDTPWSDAAPLKGWRKRSTSTPELMTMNEAALFTATKELDAIPTPPSRPPSCGVEEGDERMIDAETSRVNLRPQRTPRSQQQREKRRDTSVKIDNNLTFSRCRSTGDLNAGDAEVCSVAPKLPLRRVSVKDAGKPIAAPIQARASFTMIHDRPSDSRHMETPSTPDSSQSSMMLRFGSRMNEIQAALADFTDADEHASAGHKSPRRRSDGFLQVRYKPVRSKSPKTRATPKQETELTDEVPGSDREHPDSKQGFSHRSWAGTSTLSANGPSRPERSARRRRKKNTKDKKETCSLSPYRRRGNTPSELLFPYNAGAKSESDVLDTSFGRQVTDGDSGRQKPSWIQDDEPCGGTGCCAPVEFVTVSRDDVPVPNTGDGRGDSLQKSGMRPVLIETCHGVLTTMDSSASLTWAYDPSSGTYRMTPVTAPATGMPWLCVCGQENEADFNFCGVCATPQRWICPCCHFQKNKCRFPHCGGCGARRAENVDLQPPRPTYYVPAVESIY